MNGSAARGHRLLVHVTLAVAYLQVVFGGIVRITGSGMGCGDDWPKCAGYWFPPLDQTALVIEVTHRYLALAVSLLVLGVVVSTRREPMRALRGPALGALALVVAAALLGAATVKLGLSPLVVVAHLVLAMALLATLTWIALRLRAPRGEPVTERTRRASLSVAVGALVVVALGALTANVPGSAGSCIGFPHCRMIAVGGTPLWIQIAHRALAIALALHIVGVFFGVRRRGEPADVRRAASVLLGIVTAQVLLAAAMIEMSFPAVLRSLHQAVGALVWIAAFALAATARLARDAGTA